VLASSIARATHTCSLANMDGSERRMRKWTRAERKLFKTFLELHTTAAATLGEHNWFLLQTYGRIMQGPSGGLYVGGISMDEALSLVHALARGESVPVHLMHRHRSGSNLSSTLRFIRGRLVMSFPDHDEFA